MIDGVLTATISVPMKEKAAWEATLHHPTNLPVAPGMSLYWTNGPGFFQYRKPILVLGSGLERPTKRSNLTYRDQVHLRGRE